MNIQLERGLPAQNKSDRAGHLTTKLRLYAHPATFCVIRDQRKPRIRYNKLILISSPLISEFIMASVLKDKDEMESAISKLAIDSAKAAPKGKAKAKKPVADSWEDEDVSDEEDEDDQATDKEAEEAGTSTPSSLATPAVPPPTPASPLGYDSPHEWASLGSQSHSQSHSQSQSQSPMATSASGSGAGTPAKRPEKTDAVARRMIAAGLGLKAPRQTEEQRAYQRSVREQEKKRRDAERAEEERQKELAEKAKAAVWDD